MPFIGAYHTSDLLNIFGGGELTDYLVHFVNNLDPNGPLISGETFHWPRYDVVNPQLLTLLDAPEQPLELTADTFRVDGMDLIMELTFKTAKP
jgi:acetylcholinesterase